MERESLLEREVPFPELPLEEFRLRQERTKELMSEFEIDGLLLFNPINVAYYSGFRSPCPLQWIQCCMFSSDGRMSIIMPQIFHAFSRSATWIEEEWIRPYGGAHYWGVPQDPVEVIVRAIKDLGLADKTIGVETGASATFMVVALDDFDAVRKALPGTRFKNAVDMIFKQRMIKTSWEQDVMRRVVDITIKGYQTALENIREGMTEEDILRICWKVFVEEGACDTPMRGIVVFRGGAKDYGMSVPRQANIPLTKGRQMFFDGGANLKGYYCDFQRQLCIGEPPSLQKRLVELSEIGQQEAEKLIKPGNRVCDIHAAAMKVIDSVPADLTREGVEHLYSHTFMGHGIGLNVHEPPMISADDETVLEPGMVLCMEIPALDIPRFRVLGGFPEDIYLVTEDGHEVLTAAMERKEYIL